MLAPRPLCSTVVPRLWRTIPSVERDVALAPAQHVGASGLRMKQQAIAGFSSGPEPAFLMAYLSCSVSVQKLPAPPDQP